MNQNQYSASVKRIITFESGPDGSVTPVVLFEAKGKKKKSNRMMKPLEKVARRMAEAQAAASEAYLERHNESSEKKKNGWLRDMGQNIFKAAQKGSKRLRTDSLF